MRIVTLTLFFLFPFWANAVDSGVRVSDGDYASVVAIARGTAADGGGPFRIFCTGVVIHPKFVLTAAHCTQEGGDRPGDGQLREFARSLRVHLGSGHESGDIAESLFRVRRVHIHPEYLRSIRGHSDVALIELQENLPIAPEDIPRLGVGVEFKQKSLRRLKSLRVVGFGFAEMAPLPGAGLRGEEFFGLKHSGLIRIESRHVNEILIVGGESAPRDGDSGGPAFVPREEGEPLVVAGLVSRSTQHNHGPRGSALSLLQDSVCWLERVTELSLRGENAGPDHCEQTDLGFDPDLIEGKTFFEFCNEAGPLSRQVTLHALKTILGADSCAQLEERLSESTNLNLDAAELMDLSPLSFFPQLERLSLRDNRLRTVAPLASLPNLRFVDISYNDVRDASLLGGGGLGSRLWLVGEKRQEWNLPRTNFIRICSRPAEASPEAMRTVRAIVEQLGLRPRQCVNANYELIRLKSWEFWRVRGLVDMSPLADLASLEELSLRKQNVADIGFLSTLPELRKLMLDGNPVTDFSPIANLPILNSLSVQNMQIRDISFVNALRRLRDLSVHNNYIQDFSSLVPQENRGLEVSGKNLQTIPAN